MKNLRSWLSDPSWAGLGTIVTIVGLIIGLIAPKFLNSASGQNNDGQVTESKQPKLIVHQISENDLLDLPGGLGQVNLLINGNEENFVKFHEFQIGYQGDHHISQSDFVEPLRIEVNENRKIINIRGPGDEARANFNANYRKPNVGIFEDAVNEPISLDMYGRQYLPIFDRMVASKWKRVGINSGELEPLLLNPGEGFQIIVYTSIISPSKNLSDTELSSKRSFTDFNWTCRIADVECPAEPEYLSLPQPTEPNPFLTVWVYYQGWEVYYLMFSIVSLFAITLLLGGKWGTLKAVKQQHFWLIIVSMMLSVSTGEILTDWVFRGRNIGNQPLIAKLLLFGYLILVIYLLLPKLGATLRNFLLNQQNTQ
mgnify:CR=1 FL=1